MENFVVSARKYRPSNFNSVVGQSHITTTLKNAIKNNHLAQAFLFCGPRGVGKTTCARILAKTINCQNKTAEMEACNECSSCKAFNTQSSMNIHELDAASNNSVDDIRNLVDQVRYAPQSGKYKIYIIDEVHMLSNAAFNAFLKTLEEPPKYAIFILATTEKHKIIPTILSRCQIFDFNRIQVQDIAGHLEYIAGKESITAEAEALNLIAQKADGALRDALSIFDLIVTFSGNELTYQDTIKNLHILDYDYYFKMTDYLLAEDVSQALLTFDEILRHGFDGHNFIVGLSEHFRNLLVSKDTKTVQLLQVSETVQKRYIGQANEISKSFLLSALNLASQCDINYKSAKNQRLHVELALMKMAHITSAVRLAQNGGIQATAAADEAKKKSLADNSNGSNAQPAATPKPAAAAPRPVPAMPKPAAAETPKPAPKPMTSAGGLKKTTKINTDLSSLKSKVNNRPAVESNTAQQTQATTVAQQATVENKPFTTQDLAEYWNNFAEYLKNQNRAQDFTFMKHEWELKENNLILLKLTNTVMLGILERVKGELLDYLRKNLNNNSISIEAEIIETTNVKMIYTPQEKFEHLAEKYPELGELRNRLGLDPDL
jgi:DNA polymerase III subunit gamma/tau